MGDGRQLFCHRSSAGQQNAHSATRLSAGRVERNWPRHASRKSYETKPREHSAKAARSKRIGPYSTKWPRHINDWHCTKNCCAAIVRAQAKERRSGEPDSRRPTHSGPKRDRITTLGALISVSCKIPGTFDHRINYTGAGDRVAMSGDRSRERRRLAAECLAAAKQTSDARARGSLLEMAQRWLNLAEVCEHDAWNEALRLRALQAAIGKELRVHYELPQQLPHEMLTLLMQLAGQPDAD
jgi:hypothetical protein